MKQWYVPSDAVPGTGTECSVRDCSRMAILVSHAGALCHDHALMVSLNLLKSASEK